MKDTAASTSPDDEEGMAMGDAITRISGSSPGRIRRAVATLEATVRGDTRVLLQLRGATHITERFPRATVAGIKTFEDAAISEGPDLIGLPVDIYLDLGTLTTTGSPREVLPALVRAHVGDDGEPVIDEIVVKRHAA